MSNIPNDKTSRWYERNGIQFELDWNILPAALGLKNWAFSYDGAYLRWYRGYKCFWLRGWVRILGLMIGGGIFMRGKKDEA